MRRFNNNNSRRYCHNSSSSSNTHNSHYRYHSHCSLVHHYSNNSLFNLLVFLRIIVLIEDHNNPHRIPHWSPHKPLLRLLLASLQLDFQRLRERQHSKQRRNCMYPIQQLQIHSVRVSTWIRLHWVRVDSVLIGWVNTLRTSTRISDSLHYFSIRSRWKKKDSKGSRNK